MAQFRISMNDATGNRLGHVEADTPEAAAVKAAQTIPQLGGNEHSGAMRVTGDPGKTGCFRVTSRGPNRQTGETSLDCQFHVF